MWRQAISDVIRGQSWPKILSEASLFLWQITWLSGFTVRPWTKPFDLWLYGMLCDTRHIHCAFIPSGTCSENIFHSNCSPQIAVRLYDSSFHSYLSLKWYPLDILWMTVHRRWIIAVVCFYPSTHSSILLFILPSVSPSILASIHLPTYSASLKETDTLEKR